jgi:Fe2+ transport system protein FeoA
MALPLIFKNKVTAVPPRANGSGRLDQAKPGSRVIVMDLGSIDAMQKDHLQAYGLTPGRQVIVLRQRPVTVVQIEYTELAFEKDIAEQVLVTESN